MLPFPPPFPPLPPSPELEEALLAPVLPPNLPNPSLAATAFPAFPVSSLALLATALRAGCVALAPKSFAPLAAIPPILGAIPKPAPPAILFAKVEDWLENLNPKMQQKTKIKKPPKPRSVICFTVSISSPLRASAKAPNPPDVDDEGTLVEEPPVLEPLLEDPDDEEPLVVLLDAVAPVPPFMA